MNDFSKKELEVEQSEIKKKGWHHALVSSLWFFIALGSIVFRLRPLFVIAACLGMVFLGLSFWRFKKAKDMNDLIKQSNEVLKEQEHKDIDSLQFFHKNN